jgi:hypothetical protein
VTGAPTGPSTGTGPVAAFLALPLGTRVVVRYRVGELATDALGLLVRRGPADCDIRTRKGDVTVRFADIVAAKQVPPPPVRRNPGLQSGS